MKTTLILLCGGSGKRAKLEKNKVLSNGCFTLENGQTVVEPIFIHTLNAFIKTEKIDEYVVVSSKLDQKEISALVPPFVKITLGGETRTQSVLNGLKIATGDIVLIHDGARPFVTQNIIEDCIDSVIKFGSGVTATPSSDTVFSATENEVNAYLGKSGLYNVQTPQGFFTKDIVKAYEHADGKTFNDDGEVYKNYFKKLRICKGSAKNVKLTYPEDFERFSLDVRTGVGFDCHKLVENRKLILGGIEIPFCKGLLGHSDADVLTHAVMDALLSSAGLRDIGYYFPDSDKKYKDADSIKLLEQVLALLQENAFKVKSVSAVIMAEKPKLKEFIPKIKERLAKALNVNVEKVGIGATTLEGLGFVGREEGICVSATATIEKIL